MHVVLLDSDRISLQATAQYLTAYGFDVCEAENADHVLECLQIETIDAIIVDLADESRSLLAEVTAHHEWDNIPIVVTTAIADVRDVLHNPRIAKVFRKDSRERGGYSLRQLAETLRHLDAPTPV